MILPLHSVWASVFANEIRAIKNPPADIALDQEKLAIWKLSKVADARDFADEVVELLLKADNGVLKGDG